MASINKLIDIAYSQCTQCKIPQHLIKCIYDQKNERSKIIASYTEHIKNENSDFETDISENNERSIGIMAIHLVFSLPQSYPLKALSMCKGNINKLFDCDRYGVLDRVAAALALSLLKDLNIVDDGGHVIVIGQREKL